MVQYILVSATLATSSGSGQWSIVAKEMTPVVVATVLWGNFWRSMIVLVHCDTKQLHRWSLQGTARTHC